LADFERRFDLLECIACGLCLEVCPTYDRLRDEGSGPRGRILLMDLLDRGSQPEAWALHLDQCIGCLACQARCPAGVPYGAMLDRAHERLRDRRPATGLARWLESRFLDGVLPERRRLARLFVFLRALQNLGLLALARALRLERFDSLAFMKGLRWLPRLRRPGGGVPPRAGGPFLYFEGCVEGLLFPEEERATLDLLDGKGGYRLVEGATCCGAVHRHRGDLEGAIRLAKRNIEAYEKSEGIIVTQAAGCGAALKSYGEWLADDPRWAERARRFSERVRDLCELLQPSDLEGAAPRALTVTYDDPCHAIHAQGLREQPRRLLAALPGLRLAEMPHAERCCGAGGTWFLTQEQLSTEILAEKMDELEATGASLLLTSNPGCRLQWEKALRDAGSPVKVRHPAQLWAGRKL